MSLRRPPPSMMIARPAAAGHVLSVIFIASFLLLATQGLGNTLFAGSATIVWKQILVVLCCVAIAPVFEPKDYLASMVALAAVLLLLPVLGDRRTYVRQGCVQRVLLRELAAVLPVRRALRPHAAHQVDRVAPDRGVGRGSLGRVRDPVSRRAQGGRRPDPRPVRLRPAPRLRVQLLHRGDAGPRGVLLPGTAGGGRAKSHAGAARVPRAVRDPNRLARSRADAGRLRRHGLHGARRTRPDRRTRAGGHARRCRAARPHRAHRHPDRAHPRQRCRVGLEYRPREAVERRGRGDRRRQRPAASIRFAASGRPTTTNSAGRRSDMASRRCSRRSSRAVSWGWRCG